MVGFEIGRQIEPSHQVAGYRTVVFEHNGNRHVFSIQRQPVSEDKEQYQG